MIQRRVAHSTTCKKEAIVEREMRPGLRGFTAHEGQGRPEGKAPKEQTLESSSGPKSPKVVKVQRTDRKWMGRSSEAECSFLIKKKRSETTTEEETGVNIPCRPGRARTGIPTQWRVGWSVARTRS